jgi:methylated-DNA-protein-cysteine methyltransferase-like protein
VRSSYERIYGVVACIPRGRVATYGQVAEIAGLGRAARQVGYALHALGSDEIPWHRVINARGEVSLAGEVGEIQRQLLEQEGVEVNANGRIDLKRYRWQP